MRPNFGVAALIFFFVGSFLPDVMAKSRRPEPFRSLKKVTLPDGEVVENPSSRAALPLYVYGNESGKPDAFVASGYMGDSSSLKSVTSRYDASAPSSTGRMGRTSLRIKYLGKGREGWAGLYWQKPANNWGRIKGAGYDLRGAKKLTFWIRGEKGGEKVVQIKVGGISGPYPDSDVASIGPLKLSRNWSEYSISLEGKDMSHIVGGFAIIFRRQDNPKGATIYLDGIKFVGEEDEEESEEN